MLDKGNVKIGAVIDGLEPHAVLGHQHVGNQFLPYVGRVADHHMESVGEFLQQEVALREPGTRKLRARSGRKAVLAQQRQNRSMGLEERCLMQLNAAYRG